MGRKYRRPWIFFHLYTSTGLRAFIQFSFHYCMAMISHAFSLKMLKGIKFFELSVSTIVIYIESK